jgi:hypothetical protein
MPSYGATRIGAAVAPAAKADSKVLDHISIHPIMGGGHRVEQHFAGGQEPVSKDFAGPHEPVNLPEGHVLEHIAGHMGIQSSTKIPAAPDAEKGY